MIHATKTHLDKNISNSEIIDPNHYDIFRKDRVFEEGHEGGGVLNIVRKDLYAQAVTMSDADCEIVWNKIEQKGKKPLFTGVFYRPPNNDCYPLENLKISLQNMIKSNNLPNIVLTGDFNMPDIVWENESNESIEIKKFK